MSFKNIRYFLKEGFKNVWSNSIMSMASVLVMTCCMILTGGAILLSLNLNQALKSIEDQNTLTVFLKKDVSASEAKEIGKQIFEVPNISKCDYYSSEQAVEKYKDVLGDLYEIVQEGDNPFPEAFHITMKDLSLYSQTIDQLMKIDKIESISDRSETASRLSGLNRLISTAGLWVIGALGGVSLFIIANTIKLTMYNRRFEISIMKSVGATNGFIRAPFIIEGIIIGCISALISTFILNAIYDSLFSAIGDIVTFHGIHFNNIFSTVLYSFLTAGILFGALGGIISISRYLRKEGGDVVAW